MGIFTTLSAKKHWITHFKNLKALLSHQTAYIKYILCYIGDT